MQKEGSGLAGGLLGGRQGPALRWLLARRRNSQFGCSELAVERKVLLRNVI